MLCAAAAVAALAACPGASAADHIKLGFMGSLSGPLGINGAEMKRGLDLALADLGNKLGGVPVELSIADDKGNPATAVEEASKLIDKDKVDIVTGVGTTFVILAVAKSFADADIPVVGALGGPKEFAGKACNRNIFSASFENDIMAEALGKYMTDKRIGRVFYIGLDFQAGWESIAAARRNYKGDVVGQIFTPLNQLDFAAELAQIRAAKPDAVHTFFIAAPGIAFLKQYAQAGLAGQAPLYGTGGFVDPLTFPAVGAAALGVTIGTVWNPEIDNPANKKFVAEFTAKYGRAPTMFSALQFDAVKLIDSAVKATGGKVADKAALRAALKKADFASVRGPFKFNNNQYPIENVYIEKAVSDPASPMKMKMALQGLASANWQDSYHQDCALK
jgi:branched-chain amino acid transport system substrate-binding protein